jgi:N-acetylglutamate synthase-like GNAT family acetyltransferase
LRMVEQLVGRRKVKEGGSQLESKSSMSETDKERMGAEPIRTRTAELADAENIARLVNIAFRPERFFIDADRTDPDKVRVLLQKGKFLLAEEVSKLVGCVYMELRGERGYFGLLAVDPARQHSGMGSFLIEAAEDYCRAAGCLFMDLTIVNLRKELPGYYRRRGYLENGTLPFPEDQHPPKIPCHLVRMSKPLG